MPTTPTTPKLKAHDDHVSTCRRCLHGDHCRTRDRLATAAQPEMEALAAVQS